MATIANFNGFQVLSEENYNKIAEPSNSTLYFVELPMETYIIETYQNGDNWYRIWSDGTIEQGGYEARADATQIISFMMNYTSAPNIQISAYHTAAGTDGKPPLINTPTTTGFTLSLATAYAGVYWYAIGK